MTPIQKKPDVNSTTQDIVENIVAFGLFGLAGGLAARGAARLARKAVAIGDESMPPETKKLRHFRKLDSEYIQDRYPELKELLKKHADNSSLLLKPMARYLPAAPGCEEFDPLHFLNKNVLPTFLLGTALEGAYTEEFINRCQSVPSPADGLEILFRGTLPLLMLNPLTSGLGILLFQEALSVRNMKGEEKFGRFLAERAADIATHGAYSVGKKILSEVENRDWKEDVKDIGLMIFAPGLSSIF